MVEGTAEQSVIEEKEEKREICEESVVEEEEEKREICADVCREILSYLGAGNLQTLKSVSKYWLQLITSPSFVRLHNSRSRFRFRILITLPCEIAGYYNYDDQEMRRIPYPPLFASALRRLDSYLSDLDIKIVGSADGLICLIGHGYDEIRGIPVLFNPSTGKWVQLSPQVPKNNTIICSWFGKCEYGYVLVMGTVSRDPIHYEFGYWDPGPERYEFGVYKFASSKLKHIHSSVFTRVRSLIFNQRDIGTLVNGVVHWPVLQYMDNGVYYYSIFAYNIHENKYWEISTPAQCVFKLGVNVDGCLLGIFNRRLEIRVFEIWVLKKSWTKLAEFSLKSRIVLTPLGIFPNGDLILDADKCILMKYSFNDNEATLLMKYPHECGRYKAIICADTLVSPSALD